MRPLLDNLPINLLQDSFQTNCMSSSRRLPSILTTFCSQLQVATANNFSSYISVSHSLGRSLSWGSTSLRPRDEIEFTDAAYLGLIRTDSASPFNPDIESSSALPHHFDFRLSTFRNPLHALTMFLHAFSKNYPTNSYVGKHHHLYRGASEAAETKLLDLMDDFSQQVPESLLVMLVGLDCESIQSAWAGLLDWTLRIDNQNLFRSLANSVLKSSQWIDYCPNHTQLRIVASWFGSRDICNSLLVNYKCCLNKRPLLAFPRLLHKDESQWDSDRRYRKRYTALAAAAIRGNVEIVGLLRSKAQVDKRCQGFTPAGHVFMALNKDNQFRDGRLQVLSLLHAGKADVYGIFFNEKWRTRCEDRLWAIGGASTSTLLDEALLSADSEIADLFRPYIRDGHESQISLSGIILAADKGVEVFSDYLRSTCSSEQEQERRTMERSSLSWCNNVQRIEAISSMVQAGFDITVPLRSGASYRPFLDGIFHSESPLTSASTEMASFILSNY